MPTRTSSLDNLELTLGAELLAVRRRTRCATAGSRRGSRPSWRLAAAVEPAHEDRMMSADVDGSAPSWVPVRCSR
jgi:hypothetical protein